MGDDPEWHGGDHVRSVGHVHLRGLEQAVLDGGAGTEEGLLTRLEHELDGTELCNLGLAGLEQASGTQQRGGVQVVPAGVHAPAGGGEGLAGLLGNGQGVHVRAKQDGGTGLLVRSRAVARGSRLRAAADERDHAGAVHRRAEGNPQLLQVLPHKSARLRQAE